MGVCEGVQGQQNGCLFSRWTEPYLLSSPVFEGFHRRRPVLLLQLQARFVSSAGSEHGGSVRSSSAVDDEAWESWECVLCLQ